MELELENLHNYSVAVEALNLIDTHFRALPSLPEIILDANEDGPSEILRRIMEGYGWVLRTRWFFEVEGWDRMFSDVDSDDYGSSYDDEDDCYDDDDYTLTTIATPGEERQTKMYMLQITHLEHVLNTAESRRNLVLD
ncbi:hypothetical protein V3481_012602 [Fusarium oxysporum f. sp. vasinfectum]